MQNITFDELCNVIDMSAATMDNYMYVVDFINDRYHISKQALERFNVPSETFYDVANTHEQFVYAKDYPSLKKELEELADSDRISHNMQYRWIAKDGYTPIWINCRGNIIRDNGKALYMIGCINEIGAKPKADNQSGMLRLGGDEQIPKEINSKHFEGYIIRVGIDDLRGINARKGTEMGDYVISQTAEIILSLTTSDQFVYRIEGDEFLIVCLSKSTFEEALALYKKIRKLIVTRIRENSYKVIYTVSAGIITSEDVNDYSIDLIMQASEFALTMAKQLGRNAYCRFDESQYDYNIRQHELEKTMLNSLNKNYEGFDVNYQILNSEKEGIIGAETLMRYKDSEGNVVSPMDFIPVLENSGLIIPAGRWVLKKACETCLKVQKYIPEFFVSVNISYIQVSRTNIAEDIEVILQETGLKPKYLVVELTESGMLESDVHFNNTWKKLKALGVRLALDDFGTGYSNFHYLNELRPDILKVDRGFTVSALKDEYEFVLLYNLRNLAKNLSLNFCVEGIETEDECRRINEIEPEYMQGYYFGKPESEDKLIDRAKNQS